MYGNEMAQKVCSVARQPDQNKIADRKWIHLEGTPVKLFQSSHNKTMVENENTRMLLMYTPWKKRKREGEPELP